MKKISLELTENELQSLAEMAAFALTLQGIVKTEEHTAKSPLSWQRIAGAILDKAHTLPRLSGDMVMHPELRHWFFTHEYADKAYYMQLIDDLRDSIFWVELVQRMAEQTLLQSLSAEEYDGLSETERNTRISSLEEALWAEVTRHGIERLIFLLPEVAR